MGASLVCMLGQYLIGGLEARQEVDFNNFDECIPRLLDIYNQVFEDAPVRQGMKDRIAEMKKYQETNFRNPRSTFDEARYSQVSAMAARFMQTMSIFYRAGLFNTIMFFIS